MISFFFFIGTLLFFFNNKNNKTIIVPNGNHLEEQSTQHDFGIRVLRLPQLYQNIREQRQQDVLADASYGPQSLAQGHSLVVGACVHEGRAYGVHEYGAVGVLNLAELYRQLETDSKLVEVGDVKSEESDEGLETRDYVVDSVNWEVFLVAESFCNSMLMCFVNDY